MEKTIFSGITGIIAFGIVIVAGCIFACGAIFLFGVAPDLENDAKEISGLPEFAAASNGTKVIHTGVITDGDILTSDRRVGDISEYEFVGYVVEVWQVNTTGGSSSSRNRRTSTGTWSDAEAYAGNFVLDNGSVTINPENGFEIDGDMHEFVLPSSSGVDSDTYNGQTLREGSQRIRGFQIGDQVTLVGQRSADTALSAERIFGGTRDELVSDLESEAEASRTAGYIIMGCSACVFFPGILFAAFSIFGRRLFKKKATTPAYAPPPPNAFGSGTFGAGPSNPFGTPPAGSSGIPSGSFGGNPTINPAGFGTPSTPTPPTSPTPPSGQPAQPPPADDPFSNPSTNPFADDPPSDSNEGQRF